MGSYKICIAHYLLLFELEVQRVEILDVLIVGEDWQDHNKKNEKRFLHLVLLRCSVSTRGCAIIELSHAILAQLLFALFHALTSGIPISIAFDLAALIYLFILSMPIRRW